MQLSKLFKKKSFLGIFSVFGAAGIVAAIAIPVSMTKLIDEGKQTVKEKFSELGIEPDTTTESSFLSGNFIDRNKKLNLVALGDSVTSGYTTLLYTADGIKSSDRIRDNLSYADFLAETLFSKSRLNNYNNLARSGSTSSDLINTILSEDGTKVIKNADIVTITIGANDLLKVITLFGGPFNTVSRLINGSRILGFTSSKARIDIGREAVNNVTMQDLASQMLPYLASVYNNNPEAMFGVDKSMLDMQVDNSGAEILRSLSAIHKLAPNAQIYFNEYVYPFNQYIHNGKNITEVENKVFTDLGYGTNTLRQTYDYLMTKIKDKISENFKSVKWFSMQNAQNKIIENLFTEKIVASKEEAYKLLQKDLSDIHPTEYAHALIAQEFFNTEMAPFMSENLVDKTYSEIKAKVSTAFVPTSDIFSFMLKNNRTSTDNLFFAKLFKKISESTKEDQETFTSFLDNFLQALYLITQAGSFTAYVKKALPPLASIIEKFIFGKDQELYELFTKSEDFTPNYYSSSISESSLSFYGVLKSILLESEISHTDYVYSNIGQQLFNLSSLDKSALSSKNPTITEKLDTLENATKFAKVFFEKMNVLFPTNDNDFTNLLTEVTLPLFKETRNELNRALTYATKLAQIYPGLLKDPKAYSRQLQWKDLRRDSKGKMNAIV